MPNTSEHGFAYGIHSANCCEAVMELANEIMQDGRDETYAAAVEELKSKVKGLLDDPDGIAEYTGVDPYMDRGDDAIIDDAFEDFVRASLRLADLPTDQDFVERVAGCFGEGEWDWEDVFDAVLERTADMFFDGEPHTYTMQKDLESGECIELMLSPLGGAQLLWVIDSPYVTTCCGCSPCIPGGGDLDNPTQPGAGILAHCLPPQWLDEELYHEVHHLRELQDG